MNRKSIKSYTSFDNEETCSFFTIDELCKPEQLPKSPIKL